MSRVGSIPDEWVLDQTPYHRFLLWAAWKAKGGRFSLSVREVAYALHISKGAAERVINQARADSFLKIAPVPVARDGAFYDLLGLLEYVSQEVSQLASQENQNHKNLGHEMGQTSDKQQDFASCDVNTLNVKQLQPLESTNGRDLGHFVSVPSGVPASVPSADKKPRRLPPSKREKERDKLLGGYHPDTRMVLEALVAIWPEERSNKSKINCPFADTVARIDEHLQDGVPAKDLIDAAKLYLEESKGFESEIRFFLGPGKPGSGPPKWTRYVRAIRFSAPTPMLAEAAVN